jgi:hypothetical protein
LKDIGRKHGEQTLTVSYLDGEYVKITGMSILSTIDTQNLAHPRPGRSWGIILIGLFGASLFLVSRKIVWGPEEELSAPLWLLALFPYVCLYLVQEFCRRENALRFLKESDFLAIWTAGLFIFVVARGLSISDRIEDFIYNALVPGAARYMVLSILYMSAGFLVVAAWRCIRDQAKFRATLAPRFVAYILGVLVFWACVFIVSV